MCSEVFNQETNWDLYVKGVQWESPPMETNLDGPWDLLAWSLLGVHLPGRRSKTDNYYYYYYYYYY